MSDQNPRREEETAQQVSPQARRPKAADNARSQENTQVPPQENRSIDEPNRFDGQRAAPPRESQSTTKAPAVASGMFVPVVILVVVAVILILVLVF